MRKSNYFFIRFMIIFSLLLPLFYPKLVHADALEDIEDVLEDSRPSTDSNHTVQFVTPSGVAAGQAFTIEFDDGGTNFTISGTMDYEDFDLAVDEDGTPDSCSGTLVDQDLAAAPSGTTWGVGINTTTDVVTITSGTDTIASNTCVIIEIGDNAQYGVGGAEKIENPSSANYYDILVDVNSGTDSGTAKVVIVDTLTARVTISETLTFTVSAVATGSCDDRPGDNVNEVATTVGTLVDFGSVTTEEFYDACHQLEVGTNAAGGYVVTVTESDQLTYGAQQIADGNCDSSCTESSEETWATSANNGFGYCIDDITGDAGATAQSGMDQCDHATVPEYKIFPELNQDTPEAQNIMSSAGALTTNDQTQLGYRVTVPSATSAGTYENNIILICTPTY